MPEGTHVVIKMIIILYYIHQPQERCAIISVT